ncbi:alpha/beta fold hydrolase [Novosphingobium terrae]|uniref:alpha/beta fold hydrolase n=1 Tax=Novosphingobium terrae TaxID=2726189 RepID=UPI00197E23A6|nr:alpha/beta fold hydrolase [Novosphingobium terrae]
MSILRRLTGSRPVPQSSELQLDGPLAQRHRLRVVGEGPDLLVFSHGLGTDQSIWNPMLEGLPERYRAVLFDLPGAGPLLPDDFDPKAYDTLDRFADDLLALFAEVGITRCRYIGHSVSGMIGALAAIRAPQLFEQLVFLNASPHYINDNDYVGGMEPEDIDALLSRMAAHYQGWVEGFAPLAVAEDMPEAVRDFTAGLLAMRPDVTVQIARTIFLSDVRSKLGRLKVPTVLIHSHGDIVVPDAVAHYLNRAIKDSRLVWIAARGHLPHLSAPEEIRRVLHVHLG